MRKRVFRGDGKRRLMWGSGEVARRAAISGGLRGESAVLPRISESEKVFFRKHSPPADHPQHASSRGWPHVAGSDMLKRS